MSSLDQTTMNASKDSGQLYRLAVLGDGGVGKTALTIQLCMNQFVETYDPTIEDSYRKKLVLDGVPTTLEVLDTAGQEEYSSLRDTWIRDGEGFLLVYSIASRSSFSRARPYYNHILRVKDGEPFGAVLVGNKSDRTSDRQVAVQEGEQLAKELGIPFFEASAKLNINTEKAFLVAARVTRDIRKQQEEAFGRAHGEFPGSTADSGAGTGGGLGAAVVGGAVGAGAGAGAGLAAADEPAPHTLARSEYSQGGIVGDEHLQPQAAPAQPYQAQGQAQGQNQGPGGYQPQGYEQNQGYGRPQQQSSLSAAGYDQYGQSTSSGILSSQSGAQSTQQTSQQTSQTVSQQSSQAQAQVAAQGEASLTPTSQQFAPQGQQGQQQPGERSESLGQQVFPPQQGQQGQVAGQHAQQGQQFQQGPPAAQVGQTAGQPASQPVSQPADRTDVSTGLQNQQGQRQQRSHSVGQSGAAEDDSARRRRSSKKDKEKKKKCLVM